WRVHGAFNVRHFLSWHGFAFHRRIQRCSSFWIVIYRAGGGCFVWRDSSIAVRRADIGVGGAAVFGGGWASDIAEAAGFSSRTGYDPRASGLSGNLCGFFGDVGLHCWSLPGSSAVVWNLTAAANVFQSFPADGFEHGGIVDSIARGRRRLAVGNDFGVAAHL